MRVNDEGSTLEMNFVLVTLYKIDEVYFRLLGANGFHIEAVSERLTAAGSRSRQSQYENFTSFSRLRQKNCTKKRAHVQQDYFSSFNQSNL